MTTNETLEDTQNTEDTTTQEDTSATKTPRARLTRDMIIRPKTTAPLLREGTNRYRNQAVVISCATVGEALDRLRALEPSPGSGADIHLALECDAIEVLTPAKVA